MYECGQICFCLARVHYSKWRATVPFLAWNNPDLLTLSVWCDQPRLPPLIIRSIYNMEDIPVREAQALAGQAAVPRSIVVKQSSTKSKGFDYTLLLLSLNLSEETPQAPRSNNSVHSAMCYTISLCICTAKLVPVTLCCLHVGFDWDYIF